MPVVDPSRENFATRTFLLVEDFEAMRGILRDLLRRCGAKRVDVAANGQEAITALKRNKYDVIVCDYNLGHGKNGQQVLEEARQDGLINAATIWIMVTAEKTSEMVMGAIEHQPDDYLLKPVTEAALQSRLERLILRKKILAEIAAAMRAREYVRALDLCKATLEKDPCNPLEIMRIQSDLYQLIGQPEKARALFDSILARRDVVWAKAGIAKLDYQEGKVERARDRFEQIIADHRHYLDAYDWLAKIHQRLGNWHEAEQILEKALVVSPNSPHRQSALGDTAMRNEHLDVAEQAYGKALKIINQSKLKLTSPYLGMARVYTAQKKSDEALKLLGQMANEFDSDDVKLQAKAEEVRVFQATGDLEKASEVAKEVSARIHSGTHNLSPAATLDLAETFMLLGNTDTATNLLQFVVRNNDEDEELAARVVEVFDKGNMGEKGKALVESTRREARHAMDEGVRLASQGKLEEALDWLRQARSLMPRNPRLLLNLAYVIIAWIQKNGWRHDMETEARRSIATARSIVPGDKRCGELLAKLEALC